MAGAIAGALVFGAFIGLGMLLTGRVASIVPVVVLAVAGAYAAWLLGLIVFSAVRGAGPEDERTEP
ncbi:MAG: hypothetical protein NVS1B3_13950 [Candidatus Dormibacteraceae bacterium]